MSDIKITSVREDNLADAVKIFNTYAADIPHWFATDEAAFRRDLLEGARTLHDVPFPYEAQACLIACDGDEALGFVHAGIAPRLGVAKHKSETSGRNAVIRCLLFPADRTDIGEALLDRVMEFFLSQNPDSTIAFEGELGYPNMSGGAGLCPAALAHVIKLLRGRRFKESFRFVWYDREIGDEPEVALPAGIEVRREREEHDSGDMLRYTLSKDGEDASVCRVALMRDLVGEAGARRAFIYNNTTYPPFRRRGKAKLLTQYVLADLRVFAMKRAFTLVPVDNLSARKLYEGTAFVADGEAVEMEH